MKPIVTKNKERFLQAESEHFNFESVEKFKSVMEDEAESCATCGVWYWIDCLKRCECK